MYEIDDYPCDDCAFNGNCDCYDAQGCVTLADYLGIDDEAFDHWDI